MTSTPYPSYRNNVVVGETSTNNVALVAVGRCRINPNNDPRYRAIVAKNIEQAVSARPTTGSDNDTDKEERKKLTKKYMKQGVAMAIEYLTVTLQIDVSIIDIEIVLSNQDIIDTDGCIAACLLDAGCDCIVLSYESNDDIELFDIAKIPSERVIANLGQYSNNDIESIKTKMQTIKELCQSVSIQVTQNDDKLSVIPELLALGTNELKVIVEIDPSDCITEDNLPALVGKWCASRKECKSKQGVLLIDPSAELLGSSYAACIKTDRPDGLYTTVVCTRNNEALGLVYSNTESIIAALQCGRGVYYSRSRNGLWRKGDTSGHYQTLHRIDLDCDGDAVRFIVTQRGDDTPAFCHLNTLSCWGISRGISHLQQTLQSRMVNAPAGSYTARLFNDDELLKNKLVEEAQELAEADTKEHVAEELADVLYFAMTRAVKAGVTFDDAIAELDKRSRKVTRRQGDSKQYRIDAAKQILLEQQQQQQPK